LFLHLDCAVDQPVGTGYAYMATDSYVHELKEVRTLSLESSFGRRSDRH